ncbi:MAG: GNAT family N-acetyltransferase [Myxococcales bacterium]|nr:GNAT family N-acetyltransferase [Myxococcales bacterium]
MPKALDTTDSTKGAVQVRAFRPKKDSKAMYAIAEKLPEWFDEDALEVIEEDLDECPGFVAEIDGVGAGFILYYSPASIPAPSRYELIWLAVSPKHHGKGIGTALLERLEKELISLDPAAELIVWTEAESSRSKHYAMTRKFYHKHHFEDWFIDASDMEYWEVERLYLRKRLGAEKPKKTHVSRRERRRIHHQSKKDGTDGAEN